MSLSYETQTAHLDYPELTMYDMIERIAGQNPKETAYEFYGKKTSYSTFLKKIRSAARAFAAAGIQKGDAVTICMPNVPQALDCFYALDMIGAVANMVHPLSAKEEITFYLNLSESKLVLTVDMFYKKIDAARKKCEQPPVILVARMQEELPLPMAYLYIAKKGKNYLRLPNKDNDLLWKKFLKQGELSVEPAKVSFDKDRTSVILYSGGTTGTPKGICLTDYNFNALALQARAAIGQDLCVGCSMLSCMPLFHGFGLGINLHAVLVHGARCILMPTFNSKSYAKMLKKKKPNYIAGVPTIFEALLHLHQLDDVDMSFLMGMFCGGDSLSVELKKQIDTFLKEHNADIQVREGYGLTECVTASCLTPKHDYREGSIGLPFPDTEYSIVNPGTQEILPAGEQGEIILNGPTVMLGYLKNEEETNHTLQTLPDGKTWLYTGDIGKIDEDGFVYFIQRAKRIIITNGYNVYPGQIENVLDGMKEVAYSCVIGVKDRRRMQRVRAYVVLKDGVSESEETRESILKQLKLKVSLYALPREIIFRKELPRTLVNKVNYRSLEEEAMQEQESA